MKKALLLLALSTLFLLNGCVIVAGDGDGSGWSWDSDEDSRAWKRRQNENKHTLSLLNIGENRADILQKLGEPDFSESFSHNDKNYQIYFYRTHKNKGDGKTTKDETTPLVFVDNQLLGWGDKALELVMSINN